MVAGVCGVGQLARKKFLGGLVAAGGVALKGGDGLRRG